MLGTRIAALRIGAGMNQAELAQALSVSASAIGMYEQGRREPSGKMLVRLGDLFGVTTDFLLTGRPVCTGDRAALERLTREGTQAALRRQGRRRTAERFTSQERETMLSVMVEEP